MKILVIDDDDDVRRLICKMLETEGYELLEATNGDEGLRIIKKQSGVNVVISDLIMPEKEGLETIRELRKDFPEVKILAISGGGKIDSDNYLVIAKGLGADLTLNKPFTRQDLIDSIQKLS